MLSVHYFTVYPRPLDEMRCLIEKRINARQSVRKVDFPVSKKTFICRLNIWKIHIDVYN